MTVEAIKDAIAELPPTDRHSLALWLVEMEYDSWDKQMAEDFSPGGRGMALAERVRQQIAEGRATSFAEGATRARARRDPRSQ